ncbi:Fc.00g023210.m01.CDS01 [Cosmosporella sp. VM-42]
MLSRPGFLIRRLISHHRSRSDEVGGEVESCNEEDSGSVKRNIQKQRRSKSWVPSTKRKGSTAPITIRSVHSVHRISSPLPPIPNDPTNFSSSSSLLLCSCEGHTDTVTRSSFKNQKAVSALCLTEHGRTTLHSNPPKRPPHPKNALHSPSDAASFSGRISPGPSFSLSNPCVDRLEHQPSNSQAVSVLESPEGWSENVQQLILETDEAFKAARSALAEKDLATAQSCEELDTSAPPPVIHRHSRSMPLPTGLPRLRDAVSPSPLGSPARHASVKKPKKKKKAAKKPRYGTARQGKSQVRVPRWTLSENVTDILTGQRFRRIEADEMLTPGRIEELRRTREAARLNENQLAPRKSSDSARSVRSDTTETPVEPFHLQDLPSRIGASGMKTTTTNIEPSPPSIPPDQDVIHRDFSLQSDELKGKQYLYSPLDGIPPPSPKSPLPRLPSKSLTRSSAKKQKRKLATIPEVMVTTPDNRQLKPSTNRRSRKKSLKSEQNDEFFYFQSTPYTLTHPGFRHGPITFPKAEVGKGAKTMDDTLDWTAFQMAILGGAGDLFPDTSLEEDSKQAEDIISWFDSFGFETHGKLIPEEKSSQRDSAQSTVSSSPSTIESDCELPIPVCSEYPSGFWNVSASAQPLEAIKFFNGPRPKRWVTEERPKRYTSYTCQSPESLPPSPMMPLFVHTGDMSGDGAREPVPMGYNLHHDLGDFLKWESEHVYAGGYYGSP